MTDWNLNSLDADTLDMLDMAELAQPWEATYSAATYGESLNIDASMREAAPIHYTRDATSIKSMSAAIGTLPAATEAIHLWIGGQHSMGHVIPAVLELAAPDTIDALHVSTLTFSKDNAAEWASLIDDKKIKTLVILCAQYFEKTSNEIYSFAVNILAPRGVQIFPRRAHAKLACIKLSDGRTITAEGSANTRSCRTLENVTLFGSPQVYDFHVNQIGKATRHTKDRNMESVNKEG